MLTNGRRLIPFLLVFAVITTGCENTPPAREVAIPPGVSLDPPRSAPASGGLVVPGTEPDTTVRASGTGSDTTGAAARDTAAPAAPVT